LAPTEVPLGERLELGSLEIVGFDAAHRGGALRQQALNEVEAAMKRLPFLLLSVVLMAESGSQRRNSATAQQRNLC